MLSKRGSYLGTERELGGSQLCQVGETKTKKQEKKGGFERPVGGVKRSRQDYQNVCVVGGKLWGHMGAND